MAKETGSKQNRTDHPANKAKGKHAEGKKQMIPLWVWALSVIAVIVGGYLLVKSLGQQEPGVSGLPLETSVDEAAKLDQEEWFFLDVREPSEWEEAHIPYATLIPLGELTARLSEIPKDQNVIVVCRSGNRSAVGRDLLLNSGFSNVTSMAGGVSTWQAKGYPIVTGP